MTYTQSSLGSFRRCARLYRLRYGLQLSLAGDEEREVLAVGHCWHRAHEAARAAVDPEPAAHAVIARTAPSMLWIVKLQRLYAAHQWYWRNYDAGARLEAVAVEQRFVTEFGARRFEGQIDEIVRTPDGRRGIVERKTTSDSLEPDSDYWKKLRLDVQVGLYGLAAQRPDFILYDVVRKPTIAPKAIAEKERARMARELANPDRKFGPGATYYGERFQPEEVERALELQHETEALYGARLTSDIGDRPSHYFARREVPRTSADYEELERDLMDQVHLVEAADEQHAWPRNPDACHAYGTCEFFRLCSNNVVVGQGEFVEGFRRREHLHPELVREVEQPQSKGDGR